VQNHSFSIFTKVRRHTRVLTIVCALFAFYSLTLQHFDYVPIWDSLENLHEYLFLPRSSLSFSDLLFMHNGHPSLGYFWPFWIGQWIFPSEMIVVHSINLAIGSLAIISFSRIATLAFKQDARTFEVGLLTIAFAVHPLVTTYALNNSPDYGILAYFLASLWLLYSGRLGMVAISGTLLIFSKEIGVALYLLLVVFYLSGSVRRYISRSIWPLGIPILVFAAFCAYQLANGSLVFPWLGHYQLKESLWSRFIPNPFQIDFKLACLSIFVLNFQWIFTILIVSGFVYAMRGEAASGSVWHRISIKFQAINLPLRSFTFLTICTLYLESRNFPYINQRYLLVLYPLLLLTSFAVLIKLPIANTIRALLLCGMIALFLLCNFRTLDPVSKVLVGIFPFGTHPALKLAELRPECCCYARDQSVYNLEHINLARLLDLAFEKIRPTSLTNIVITNKYWYVATQLNSETFHRTVSRKLPLIMPHYITVENLISEPIKPKIIFLLLIPHCDMRQEIAELERYYELKERSLITSDGYQMEVLEMSKIAVTA